MRLFRRLFIKDFNNTRDETIRNKYGIVISLYGLIVNVFLSIGKLIIGAVTSSIALISDGINNVSDSANMVVGVVGFRISTKPADKEHPFGHARIEHIAGLVISALIVAIGVTLLIESVTAIVASFTPENILTEMIPINWWSIGIMLFSVIIKIVIMIDNYWTAKLIDSVTLKAIGRDAMSDVLVTSSLLASIIVSVILANFSIYVDLDGWMGALVSIFVTISGIKSILETSSPLIGETNSKEDIINITNIAKKHEEILGVHDVLIHNYGGHHMFISLDVEMSSNLSLMDSHKIVDIIEEEIEIEYKGSNVSIHIDPINIHCPIRNRYCEVLDEFIQNNAELDWSYHDLRVVGVQNKRLILELLVPFCESTNKKLKRNYEKDIMARLTSYIYSKEADHLPIHIIIDYPTVE